MTVIQLIERLADGHWQTVEISPQLLASIADLGLEIESDSAGRSRLLQPIELLDARLILSKLNSSDRVAVETEPLIDSTNTALMERPAPDPSTAHVLAAEFQRAGRGRQSRSWLSPFGGGLGLSVAWLLDPVPQQPGTLSLAAGVAVLRALRKMGVADVGLKWPNDLIFAGGKVGGILVEIKPGQTGLHVVAGIGLNQHLDQRSIERIEADGGQCPRLLPQTAATIGAGRNGLAAALIDELLAMFLAYQQKGFDTFRQEWNHADVLYGQTIEVAGTSALAGVAKGVDESGALLVRSGNSTQRLYSGEVRVRTI